MKNWKKLDKLDLLTLETDMLFSVLNDALKFNEHKESICEISFLADIIAKKLRKIRDLF